MNKITTERSLLKWILFSIITLGIYDLFFIYALARDINEMCKEDGKNTAGLLKLILLTIVTCGIYGIYWYYALGNRIQANANEQFNLNVTESGTTILLWMIVGSAICGIGSFIAMHIIIKNTNALAKEYNEKLDAPEAFAPDFSADEAPASDSTEA